MKYTKEQLQELAKSVLETGHLYTPIGQRRLNLLCLYTGKTQEEAVELIRLMSIGEYQEKE